MAIDPEDRRVVERWLTDPTTWVGVFENQDLGHRDIGQKVMFPFDQDKWDESVIGSTRAPDHVLTGFGWRYILIAKTKTIEEVEEAFTS